MDLELIEKQVLYDGHRIRLEMHHLLKDGQRLAKEVCVHPGAVVILPLLDAQTLVLIRNRRYAVGRILVELPAGTLEKGEDAINCAGRELLEETGYLAKRIKPMRSFYSSPGILTEKMHVFLAYDLQKQTQDLQEDEDIQVLTATLGEAIEMIHQGEIEDAKTIASLLMYERFFANQPAEGAHAARRRDREQM
jgi:ADP-ribose pyrophosphatase